MTKRTIATTILALCALAAAGAPGAGAQTAAPPAATSAPGIPPDATPPVTAAPAPAVPAVAETLTGAAAWERLKGNTIEGKAGGQTFAEYFDPAGSVKYVDKDGPSDGTWTVQGAKVCFDFPEDDDKSCSTFSVTDATGTSKEDDGTVVKFAITPGNGKGL